MFETDHPNAGILRRAGAMIYDGILIFAIWIVGGLIITSIVLSGGGPESAELTVPSATGQLLILLTAWAAAAVFYIYFWCKTGQTLGMQAWRIQLVNENGSLLDVHEGLVRFLAATLSVCALGLGFLWMLGPRRLAFHDLATGSRVVHLGRHPREPKKRKSSEGNDKVAPQKKTKTKTKTNKKKRGRRRR